MTDKVTCQHEKVQPTFDPEAAEGLSVQQIRARWPRFFGTCPDCNEQWILYASLDHFVAGDW